MNKLPPWSETSKTPSFPLLSQRAVEYEISIPSSFRLLIPEISILFSWAPLSELSPPHRKWSPPHPSTKYCPPIRFPPRISMSQAPWTNSSFTKQSPSFQFYPLPLFTPNKFPLVPNSVSRRPPHYQVTVSSYMTPSTI